MTSGVIHYADGCLPENLAEPVRKSIDASGMPIVCVSLIPESKQTIRWPSAKVSYTGGERGVLTMVRQILWALEELTTDYVFFTEQDVLYSPQHFREAPREKVLAYNQFVFKLDTQTGQCVHYRCSQLSGLSGDRLTLLAHYQTRYDRIKADGYSTRIGYEPGTHRRPERIDDLVAETWMSSVPNVDLRHGGNLTRSRWDPSEFRTPPPNWDVVTDIPGWGNARDLAASLTGVSA